MKIILSSRQKNPVALQQISVKLKCIFQKANTSRFKDWVRMSISFQLVPVLTCLTNKLLLLICILGSGYWIFLQPVFIQRAFKISCSLYRFTQTLIEDTSSEGRGLLHLLAGETVGEGVGGQRGRARTSQCQHARRPHTPPAGLEGFPSLPSGRQVTDTDFQKPPVMCVPVAFQYSF